MRLDFPLPWSFFVVLACICGIETSKEAEIDGLWSTEMSARRFIGQFVNYMKLNNTTNWAESNATRFLTQKGNCVKKILCLALPGSKMGSTSVACTGCVACRWPSQPRSGSASAPEAGSLLKTLTQLWQMQLSQKETSPQLLCGCWLWACLSSSLGGLYNVHCVQCAGDSNRFQFFGLSFLFPRLWPACFTHTGWDMFRSLLWGKWILHFESSTVLPFQERTHI